MRAPTRAAWERALKVYEHLLNERIARGADEDEKRCLYRVHGMLRERASGGEQG